MNGSDNSDTISTHSLSLADSLTGDLINNNQPSTDNSSLKYEKLIQDYVKVRSKLTILKKAYVELNEQSSQKDKSLRKNEQEIEGLTFRNQQLASRVESLQKELDQLKAIQQVNHQTAQSNITTSANNINQLTCSDTTNILEEELQHKINENASLHKRIHEIELEFEKSQKNSKHLIQTITNERLILQKKFDSLQSQSQGIIDKLQNDKIKIAINLSEKEKEIKSLKINQNLKLTVREANNERAHDSKFAFIKLINEQSKAFERLFFSMGKRGCFTQLEQTNECCEMLQNSLPQALETLSVNGEASLLNILSKFESYMKYCFNQLKNLPAEDLNGANSSEILNLNSKLINDLEALSRLIIDSTSPELQQLEKFSMSTGSVNDSSVALLNQIKQILKTKPTDSSCNKIFRNSVSAIHGALTKISAILNEKLSVEYELGYPQTTTMMDECIVSYLDELNELIAEFLAMLNNNFGIVEICNTLLTVNNEQNQKIEATKDNNDLKEANERIAKLEKDLDASDRLRYKFDQMNVQLVHLQNVEAEQRAIILRLETEKVQSLSQVKTVETVKNDNLEPVKKNFYLKKITKLNCHVQMLDSKAMFYHDEMKCMLERLKLQIDMNSLLDINLNEVKDQLERTQSSYEIQMSTMSDHLIEITNRMNRQEEENEKLKHDLANYSNYSKTGKLKKTK